MLFVETQIISIESRDFTVRNIQPQSDVEIDSVVSMTMDTVLETIPQFHGSPQNALKVFSNFTCEAMRNMIVADFDKDTHGSIVIVPNDSISAGPVGHILYSRKIDDRGRPFGYIFSMYVLEPYRRQGLGEALLSRALVSIKQHPVDYIKAETHLENHAFKALAKTIGFTETEQKQRHWPVSVIQKSV